MILLGKKKYNICFVDTCVISDMIEDKLLWSNFIQFILVHNCFVGISVYNIQELRDRPSIYNEFKRRFTSLPTFLIKPTENILQDEIESYPQANNHTIHLMGIFNNSEFLDYLEKSGKFHKTSEYIKNGRGDVLSSILKLRENFPPDRDGKYSRSRINEFVDIVTYQQLNKGNRNWVKEIKESNRRINFNHFKSLRAQLLITFWKYYLMPDRKARISDIYDISFTSCLGYVDYVFTENNIISDIRQIKNKGLFFDNLTPLNIKDLKEMKFDN